MFLDASGGLHGIGERGQGGIYNDTERTLRKLEFAGSDFNVADVKKVTIGKMQRYVLMNNGRHYFMGTAKHYVSGVGGSSAN